MAIRYDGTVIYFEDVCQIDETEQLLNTLLSQKDVAWTVDLSKCTYMHTALFQLLMASKLSVKTYPESKFWETALKSIA